MATVAAERADLDGLAATYNAASAGGDKFPPSDRTVLHIKNGSAGSVTATLTTPGKVDGVALADPTLDIPAGEERFWKPPRPGLIQGTDGLASIGWSATASVTFAVIRA